MRYTTRQERESAAYQFVISADRLGYAIEERLSPYKFLVKDDNSWRDIPLIALVMHESFDYYENRMYRAKKPFDLLIVQHHNAIVPCTVVNILTGKIHPPGDRIDDLMRQGFKRRNHDEKALLLSQIITGAREAAGKLAQLSTRQRARYQSEAKEYLCGRVGRPFGS